MPTPSPTTHSTSQLSQAREKGKLLPCIEFLKTHFEYGGVDQKGFDILYHMIEMISAVGWEVHVIYQSKITTTRIVEKIQWYLDCLLQGCGMFHSNMQKAFKRAKDAAEKLPDVSDWSDDTLETKLIQWRWKLKTLHDPTGNDYKLFRMIAGHYNDNAFNRLIELYRRKPNYGLEGLVDSAFEVDSSLEGLWQLAREADRRVKVLHDKFSAAVHGDLPAKSSKPTTASADRLAATVYKPSDPQVDTVIPLCLSKSFGIAEEAAARKRNERTSASGNLDYVTNAFADRLLKAGTQTGRPIIGRRRKDKSVPRICTESFSELESDIHSLELHKVETPETVEAARKDIKVRDFGATPIDSPCLSPSPPTLLQRREAIVSKETELHDRVLNGEVVTSRRPSTKERSRTIDDGIWLEEWLKQASHNHERPQCLRVNARRERHRENTI